MKSLIYLSICGIIKSGHGRCYVGLIVTGIWGIYMSIGAGMFAWMEHSMGVEGYICILMYVHIYNRIGTQFCLTGINYSNQNECIIHNGGEQL